VSERVIHLVRLCEAPGPLLWPYERAQALQQRLVARRQEGCVGDVLLLLEHAPVITLGLRADEGHILATAEALAEAGVAVARSERGGDVTYHGPGQLVGYPILHLASYDLGASDYMHRLEVVLMRALADFGIITHRREGIIGVWVGASSAGSPFTALPSMWPRRWPTLISSSPAVSPMAASPAWPRSWPIRRTWRR
jgi:lipoyl(octanoyl) transferase